MEHQEEYIRCENQEEINAISKFITKLVSDNMVKNMKFKSVDKFKHYQLRQAAKRILKTRDFGYKEELIALSNLDNCFSVFVEHFR